MPTHRSLRSKSILAVTLATLLTGIAGCSSDGSQDALPPPPEANIPPRGTGVFADNLIEGEATIVTVDQGTRLVTLRNDQGEVTTVKAPADADLTRVKAGDRVGVAYYESVAINLAKPDTPLGATGATVTQRAAPDQLPGRAVGDTTVITAEVTAINLNSNTVTFKGPEGNLRTVHVTNPELQPRLRNLKVGDILQFTYTEAVAIRILPRS